MITRQSGRALAAALGRVEKVVRQGVVRSSNMQRQGRERLQRAGWLLPITNGWYLFGLSPDAGPGSTTLWYGHFWDFVRYYLTDRFGGD